LALDNSFKKQTSPLWMSTPLAMRPRCHEKLKIERDFVAGKPVSGNLATVPWAASASKSSHSNTKLRVFRALRQTIATMAKSVDRRRPWKRRLSKAGVSGINQRARR
jgi:hypothetical protein